MLGRFCRIVIDELPDEPLTNVKGEKAEEAVRAAEGSVSSGDARAMWSRAMYAEGNVFRSLCGKARQLDVRWGAAPSPL